IGQFVRAQLGDPGLVHQRRHEPVLGARAERGVTQIRPFLAFRRAQKGDAMAPLQQLLCPWKAIEADGFQSGDQYSRRFFVEVNRQRLLSEHNRTKPTKFAPTQTQRVRVEIYLLSRLDPTLEASFDLGEGDFGRQYDA